MSLLSTILDAVTTVPIPAETVPPGIPDPGGGEPPPGADKALLLLKWLLWVCSGVCVGGIIYCGAKMSAGRRSGEGGEYATQLGWTLAGCIVVGAATGIAGALI